MFQQLLFFYSVPGIPKLPYNVTSGTRRTVRSLTTGSLTRVEIECDSKKKEPEGSKEVNNPINQSI